MRIKGLQKLTALDFPDRLACTVFTGGCNLRCPFCHNASLVMGIGEDMDENEFFSFLDKRKGILEGVCITGGEPLLQPDIEDFIKRVKDKGYKLKLDTNGAFPDRLLNLIQKNLLDYVAMDIKNSPQKYPLTCGVDRDYKEFFIPFKESIDILLENRVDYEFRTTVVKELHDLIDIENAGEAIRGAKNWYLQCFKDSGDTIKGGFTAPDKTLLESMRLSALNFASHCEIRGI